MTIGICGSFDDSESGGDDGASATSSVVYGISNSFSLEPSQVGPSDPAIPGSGDVAITNIHVDRGQIQYSVATSGPVYTGKLEFDLASTFGELFTWLELSTDNGLTWHERWIHCIGHVGPSQPGAAQVIHWTVDGNHGHHCKIRIRVNASPATYDHIDALNNKHPLPVPYIRYPNLERHVSKKDGFDFNDPEAMLPHVDFYKKIASSGLMKAGFARMRFFHYADQYINNPIYFLHCLYLESENGQERYVILQGDVQKLWTDTIHRWRDQIHSHFNIPKDHIMVLYTHVHNYMSQFPGVDIFPIELLEEAISKATPVDVAFVNREMNNTFNIHRCVMYTPTKAHSSFGNGVYYNPQMPYLPVQIEYDIHGEIISAWLDAAAVSSIQAKFDGPADSRLQMILFRDHADKTLKGILVKWSGHPVSRDYNGDLPRCVMDVFQNRFGSNVEVMFTSGFAGNQRQLFAQKYPSQFGSVRSAHAFADVLQGLLPDLVFAPLTRLGVVTGYDTFGAHENIEAMRGIDPERYGVGVQVFRLNNIYLSTLPGEAPCEQGIFIRARTADLNHMYTAYGNTFYNYYNWGRWFDISHYESSTLPNRYESFRMAQEIVRGTHILEQAFPNVPRKEKAIKEEGKIAMGTEPEIAGIQ